MAKQSGKKKETKLKQCLKVPFRALILVRDAYVKGMMGCAGNLYNYSAPTSTGHDFHKSFSMTNGENEYIKDLIKEASAKSFKDKVEGKMVRAEVMGTRAVKGFQEAVSGGNNMMVIGRIDENASCDFGDDANMIILNKL